MGSNNFEREHLLELATYSGMSVLTIHLYGLQSLAKPCYCPAGL